MIGYGTAWDTSGRNKSLVKIKGIPLLTLWALMICICMLLNWCRGHGTARCPIRWVWAWWWDRWVAMGCSQNGDNINFKERTFRTISLTLHAIHRRRRVHCS